WNLCSRRAGGHQNDPDWPAEAGTHCLAQGQARARRTSGVSRRFHINPLGRCPGKENAGPRWRANPAQTLEGVRCDLQRGPVVTIGLRHRCRLCRTKLKEPTDNLRRAFCCRGCFQSFYRSRCVVCADPIRRKNEQQKTCIKKACKDELRRFPLAFAWQKTGNIPSDNKRLSETLDFSGSKLPIEGDRPAFRCLANWCWGGDPGAGDHSLR